LTKVEKESTNRQAFWKKSKKVVCQTAEKTINFPGLYYRVSPKRVKNGQKEAFLRPNRQKGVKSVIFFTRGPKKSNMSRVWPAISLPFDPFFESFFSSLKFLE
jgi:hypothetical protein